MEQAGVEPNSYTYTILLNCLERRRKNFDGFQVSSPVPPHLYDVVYVDHHVTTMFWCRFVLYM